MLFRTIRNYLLKCHVLKRLKLCKYIYNNIFSKTKTNVTTADCRDNAQTSGIKRYFKILRRLHSSLRPDPIMEHQYTINRGLYHHNGCGDYASTATAEFRLTLDACQINELKKTFNAFQSYRFDTAAASPLRRCFTHEHQDT